MLEGTIARLKPEGYGFIKQEGEDKDVFFHAEHLENVSFDELRPGDKVTFEIGEGRSGKGPSAIKINRA